MLRRFIGRFVQWIGPPLIRFIARAVPEEELARVISNGPAEYVAPNHKINPLVIQAAQADIRAAFTTSLEGAQADLNACLDGIRPMETHLQAMIGAMIAQGLPPSEAVLRAAANILLLGIFVARRLDRVDFPTPHADLVDLSGVPSDVVIPAGGRIVLDIETPAPGCVCTEMHSNPLHQARVRRCPIPEGEQ
jgi:hypothetical protein